MTYLSEMKLVDEYNNEIEGTLLNQLKTAESHRLAGGIFNDGLLDSNYFTSAVANNATVSVANGECIVSTTSDTNSSASVVTTGVARYMGANSNYYRATNRLSAQPASNNTIYFGAANSANLQDGFVFEFKNSVFSVCSILNGTITRISNGSFNGNGSKSNLSFNVDLNYHTFEIYYTTRKCIFVVDSQPLHCILTTNNPVVSTRNLRPILYNLNTGGNGITLYCAVMTINRLGTRQSQPKYVHVAGANAGTVAKVGPGTLTSIVLNTSSASTIISLYDGTSAVNPIAIINTANNTTPNKIDYNVDFINGLFFTVSGTSSDITIIYE